MDAARILILCAVDQELRPLARRFRASPWPSAPVPALLAAPPGRSLLIARGGMGPRSAEAAARSLVRLWSPDLVLLAGVAGALDPELRVGDLVAAERILTGEEELVPPVLLHLGAACRRGAVLSADRVLVTVEEKRRAGAGGALAVEMETAGAARALAEAGIPWGAVRAISDDAHRALPLDFNALRSGSGAISLPRVVGAALSRPTSLPGLVRLGRDTARAAALLAGALEGALTLPAPPP